mmetsp:Transcript_7098/g.10819  ORF Transcript_7098/g.10819 Transcript_7098/m.10819 type:complete len:151 (+) Transcript_7098:329-781(+)
MCVFFEFLFSIFQILKADVAGYDPKRSRVSDDRMTEFQRSKLTGDLSEVPGIGPAAIKKLADAENDDDKITNTFQLIGKFLMLKGPDEDGNKVETREHMEKFWYFLQEKGISSHRSGIVRCIAEKVNGMMPGIYDASEYADDDDSSDDEE